jgi:hypothetical protein
MPPIDVNVATTNPKSTSKILHTARGIQKRTLNLPMRVADTLGSHTLRVGVGVFQAQIGERVSAHGINSWKQSNRRLPFSALQ